MTEAVTGLDLVALQFRVAHGETLPFTQERGAPRGPCRPRRGSMPRIPRRASFPRPDGSGRWNCRRISVSVSISGVEAGDEVSPFYESDDPPRSLRAGPIATRRSIVCRGLWVKRSSAGPRTNAAFLKKLVDAQAFRDGAFRYRLHRSESRRARRRGTPRPSIPSPSAAGALASGAGATMTANALAGASPSAISRAVGDRGSSCSPRRPPAVDCGGGRSSRAPQLGRMARCRVRRAIAPGPSRRALSRLATISSW